MPICQKCNTRFPCSVVYGGKRHNLGSRKLCLECSPPGLHNTRTWAARVRWDDVQFAAAVKTNISVAGTLRQLGLVPRGGNYRTCAAAIRRLSLDTSHWLGQAHTRGTKRPTVSCPLTEVLVVNSEYSRARLKYRLLQDKLLVNICAICGQVPEWQGKPLVLILDHINGINNDNRLENLRILCPHCNSQQSTFCGRKNKGRNH